MLSIASNLFILIEGIPRYARNDRAKFSANIKSAANIVLKKLGGTQKVNYRYQTCKNTLSADIGTNNSKTVAHISTLSCFTTLCGGASMGIKIPLEITF